MNDEERFIVNEGTVEGMAEPQDSRQEFHNCLGCGKDYLQVEGGGRFCENCEEAAEEERVREMLAAAPRPTLLRGVARQFGSMQSSETADISRMAANEIRDELRKPNPDYSKIDRLTRLMGNEVKRFIGEVKDRATAQSQREHKFAVLDRASKSDGFLKLARKYGLMEDAG